jgi:HD-GYP domain-containing protein (c-di-GMP phosphodiesterase class II)
MISNRPYRPALPLHRALAEVRACAGSQFDPAVVRAFLAAWAEGDFDQIRAA